MLLSVKVKRPRANGFPSKGQEQQMASPTGFLHSVKVTLFSGEKLELWL
jgi:hypothetical protein